MTGCRGSRATMEPVCEKELPALVSEDLHAGKPGPVPHALGIVIDGGLAEGLPHLDRPAKVDGREGDFFNLFLVACCLPARGRVGRWPLSGCRGYRNRCSISFCPPGCRLGGGRHRDCRPGDGHGLEGGNQGLDFRGVGKGLKLPQCRAMSRRPFRKAGSFIEEGMQAPSDPARDAIFEARRHEGGLVGPPDDITGVGRGSCA